MKKKILSHNQDKSKNEVINNNTISKIPIEEIKKLKVEKIHNNIISHSSLKKDKTNRKEINEKVKLVSK